MSRDRNVTVTRESRVSHATTTTPHPSICSFSPSIVPTDGRDHTPAATVTHAPAMDGATRWGGDW